MAMTHRKAVATMVLVTLMWSIAGVVTRHLQSAAAFEVTFWRSAANAVALGLLLGWQMGFAALWRAVRDDAGAEESDPCRSDLRAHAVEWV